MVIVNEEVCQPGKMKPSSANPPDQKTVVNGELDDRVQRLLPLVQHYIQLLRLAYCPARHIVNHSTYTHGVYAPWKSVQKETIFAFRFVQIVGDHAQHQLVGYQFPLQSICERMFWRTRQNVPDQLHF